MAKKQKNILAEFQLTSFAKKQIKLSKSVESSADSYPNVAAHDTFNVLNHESITNVN